MLTAPRGEYGTLLELLRGVPTNSAFARTVLEGRSDGDVFVDRLPRPALGYVVHRYGMSLLFGRDGAGLDDALLVRVLARRRSAPEWLQVHPQAWAEPVTRVAVAAALPVERHTRLNFAFRRERFEALRRPAAAPARVIVPIDRSLFASVRGSVVPQAFWNRAEDFLREGLGFALLEDGEAASVAFASFVVGTELELGIETAERHRGRGLALHVCAALIEECLRRGLTPSWACRLGNAGSQRLAEKLGFEVTHRLPYFKLPPS